MNQCVFFIECQVTSFEWNETVKTADLLGGNQQVEGPFDQK